MRSRPFVIAALLLAPIVAPRAALSQATGERVLVEMAPGVARRDLGRHEGMLLRLDADSIVLRQRSGTVALARANVAQVWVHRIRRSRGRAAALFGVPLGVLGGVVGYSFGTPLKDAPSCPAAVGVRCSDRWPEAPGVLAAAGFLTLGGLGAYFGATTGRRGWVPADGWRGVSLHLTPARVGLANATLGIAVGAQFQGAPW